MPIDGDKFARHHYDWLCLSHRMTPYFVLTPSRHRYSAPPASGGGETNTGDSMDITSLLIQLAAGALGGNAAGAALKEKSLGTLGNTLSGILGGGIGGQILGSLLGGGGAAAASGLDIGAIIQQFAGGGVGGAVLMIVVGLIKNAMNKA